MLSHEMPIRTKRWNDPVEETDGYRLLVTRYRPRGVKSEDENWNTWCPELGPSVGLHAAAYGKDQPAIAFDEYERRYRAEMERQRWFIEGFAKRVRDGETLTLLCSSACTDPNRCHRTILAKLLEDAAFPKAKATPGIVRRR